MALIKALDHLDKNGKLTFKDPVVKCGLVGSPDVFDTKSNSESNSGRNKRSEKNEYSIPIIDNFKEGHLITQAMKEISYDGVGGEGISFSNSGGPDKNTYMIVNVRTGEYPSSMTPPSLYTAPLSNLVQ